MNHRTLGLVALLAMAMLVSACGKKGAGSMNADAAYTGTLMKTAATDAAPSDWALGESTGNVLMHLDVSAVEEQAMQYESKRVKVTGMVELRDQKDADAMAVLVVNKIEPAK